MLGVRRSPASVPAPTPPVPVLRPGSAPSQVPSPAALAQVRKAHCPGGRAAAVSRQRWHPGRVDHFDRRRPAPGQPQRVGSTGTPGSATSVQHPASRHHNPRCCVPSPASPAPRPPAAPATRPAGGHPRLLAVLLPSIQEGVVFVLRAALVGQVVGGCGVSGSMRQTGGVRQTVAARREATCRRPVAVVAQFW